MSMRVVAAETPVLERSWQSVRELGRVGALGAGTDVAGHASA